jgi:hypothetical protein
MTETNLRHAFALLWRRAWSNNQIKASRRLVLFVALLVPLLFFLWPSFRNSFIKGFAATTLSLLISLLVFGIVVVFIATIQRIMYKSKLRQRKITTTATLFALSVILVLTSIILFRDISLSGIESAFRYVRELLLSIVAVVLIGYIWRKIVNNHPLDDMLLALDQGEISEVMLKEMEQTQSFDKWQQGDITGWHELNEEARFGDGLCPRTRSRIEYERRRVEQERQDRKKRQVKNGTYERQLNDLLAVQPLEHSHAA